MINDNIWEFAQNNKVWQHHTFHVKRQFITVHMFYHNVVVCCNKTVEQRWGWSFERGKKSRSQEATLLSVSSKTRKGNQRAQKLGRFKDEIKPIIRGYHTTIQDSVFRPFKLGPNTQDIVYLSFISRLVTCHDQRQAGLLMSQLSADIRKKI